MYVCVVFFVSLSPNSHANARQICFIYAAKTQSAATQYNGHIVYSCLSLPLRGACHMPLARKTRQHAATKIHIALRQAQ